MPSSWRLQQNVVSHSQWMTHIQQMVECPECEAMLGDKCHSETGKPRLDVHLSRLSRHNRQCGHLTYGVKPEKQCLLIRKD